MNHLRIRLLFCVFFMAVLCDSWCLAPTAARVRCFNLRSSSSSSEQESLQERISRELGQSTDSMSSEMLAEVQRSRAYDAMAEYENMKRRNVMSAIGSALTGAGVYFARRLKDTDTSPNPVTILREMERDSLTIPEALKLGRPIVIDFFADWCENCVQMAPAMRRLESRFENKISFIAIDGDSRVNDALIEAFRVDGIPHFAFINAEGQVMTSLIGLVPESIMQEQMRALVDKSELPYEGYDPFRGRSNRVQDILGNL